MSAGKADAQFNGRADISPELKAKIADWYTRDFNYGQISADDRKYRCNCYDLAPETPKAICNNPDAINNFHDAVPFNTWLHFVR